MTTVTGQTTSTAKAARTNVSGRALIWALAGITAALLLLVALQRYAGITEGVALTLILSAALLYGVLSGKVSELTAPGGWGAKFAAQASAPVHPSHAPIDLSTTDMEEIPKLSVEEVAERLQLVRDGRPLILTLTLAKTEDYYRTHALAWALQALSQFRNFKLVVLRDRDGKFVASAPSWLMRAAVERNPSGDRLVSAINRGDRNDVVSFPGMITECVTTQSSNAEALNAMERANLEAMVVIDATTREVVGVVERDRVLARMVLALSPGASA